mmetsp:Transcript_45501/g.110202  ORF Transcript_45501/g.110202 Transcript_45501/m.110202 type:complete len:122 (-) Transcript_45501:145-510(-)
MSPIVSQRAKFQITLGAKVATLAGGVMVISYNGKPLNAITLKMIGTPSIAFVPILETQTSATISITTRPVPTRQLRAQLHSQPSMKVSNLSPSQGTLFERLGFPSTNVHPRSQSPPLCDSL